MATEFERTKETIGGRAIVVTSWYDDRLRTWRASAPAYSYLHSNFEPGVTMCNSRKEAIARLSARLANQITTTN